MNKVPSSKGGRTVVLSALSALIAVALLPAPNQIQGGAQLVTLSIPIDPALRVPIPSILLSLDTRPVSTQSWIEELRVAGHLYQAHLRNRTQLHQGLRNVSKADGAVLYGRTNDEKWAVPAPIRVVSLLDALGQQWALLLASGFYIMVGLLMAVGGEHPVSPPVAAVSFCVGFGMLSTIDLIIPVSVGVGSSFEIPTRIGLLSWSLLPFALLHLAMRFPVVGERFRSSGMVFATYAMGLCLVVPSQLRLQDAVTLNAIEKLSFALAVLSTIVLVATSLTQRHRLSPIESTRARALSVGLCGAWIGPVIVFSTGPGVHPWLSRILTLGTLALPAALAWSVLRYHLVDPASWIVRQLRSAGVFLSSSLIGCAVIFGAHILLGERRSAPSDKILATALVTMVLYHACRGIVEGSVRRWIPAPTSPHIAVADAIPQLLTARSSREVLGNLEQVIRRLMRSSAIEVRSVSDKGATDRGGSALWRKGAESWAREGARSGGRVRVLTRQADPGYEEPEVLVGIGPWTRPTHLVVASARLNGLPYSEADIGAFERLGELAEMAAFLESAGLRKLKSDEAKGAAEGIRGQRHL